MSSETVQTGDVHLRPEKTDESEGKSCVALQCRNSPRPIWPPSPHIVGFKEPLLPVSQESLKRVVSNCKSFRLSLFQTMHKSRPFFPLKTAHCVGSLCGALHRGRGEESEPI